MPVLVTPNCMNQPDDHDEDESLDVEARRAALLFRRPSEEKKVHSLGLPRVGSDEESPADEELE